MSQKGLETVVYGLFHLKIATPIGALKASHLIVTVGSFDTKLLD